VQEGYTLSGNKKYIVTLSDGVHLLDAFVSPHLFHLFDTKAVKKQVIVTVHRSFLTVVGGCKHVVLLHLVIGAYHKHLIGNPVYITNTSQGMSTASCDVSNLSTMKFISPLDVKKDSRMALATWIKILLLTFRSLVITVIAFPVTGLGIVLRLFLT
jgi:hypothetical protein